jgi:hypothetical protein
MPKPIRDDDNPPRSVQDELLRLAASIDDDIDPRLACRLRDAAGAAQDLADALEHAAASLNGAAGKPLR